MGPAVYVMAILGCGEATNACEPVSIAPVRYESVEACQAASADILARQTDVLYPVVVAECRAEGQEFTKVYADEVKLPSPDGSRAPQVRRASFVAPRIRS